MAPPPELLALASQHRSVQQSVAAQLLILLRRLWGRIDPGAALASWAALEPTATRLVTAAQFAAAEGAQSYVAAALVAQGAPPDPAGVVAATALSGVASDGRSLASLLHQPAVAVVGLLAGGMAPGAALPVGLSRLERIAVTQVQDAARVATGVAQVNDRAVRGWIRMLQPPSCSRCVVLAGKFYATNAGFDRHPQCDCVHIPAAEHIPDLATDPKAYFDSLDEPEQDRIFTIAGARAIRDGADIGQVVNARRGATGIGYAAGRLTDAERTMLRGGLQRGRLQTTDVFGHQLFTTTEASTTRGMAGVRLGARETGQKQGRYRRAQVPRLMPESIYAEAERLGWSRDETISALKRFGYIL